MSNLNSAHVQVRSEWQSLRRQWQTICDLWRDPVQHRFEREIWQEFERTVPIALNEMKRLADVIAQAQREVS